MDPIGDAFTTRYKAMVTDNWYKREHEPIEQFRRRIGMDPHVRKVAKPAQPSAAANEDQRACVEYFTLNPSMAVLAFDRREAWMKPSAQDAEQARDATAGALREPKNGDGWKVAWWNESMRMMLPDHHHLDSFQAYRNGTLTLIIKENQNDN